MPDTQHALTRGNVRVVTSSMSSTAPASAALVIRGGRHHDVLVRQLPLMAQAAERSAKSTPIVVQVTSNEREIGLVCVAASPHADTVIRAIDAALISLRAPPPKTSALPPEPNTPVTFDDGVSDVILAQAVAHESGVSLALRVDDVGVAVTAPHTPDALMKRVNVLLTTKLDPAEPDGVTGEVSLPVGLHALIIDAPPEPLMRAAVAVLASMLDVRVVRGAGKVGIAFDVEVAVVQEHLTELTALAPPPDVITEAVLRAQTARAALIDSGPRAALSHARAVVDNSTVHVDLNGIGAVSVSEVLAVARALMAATPLVGAQPLPPQALPTTVETPIVRATAKDQGLPVTIVVEGARRAGASLMRPCGEVASYAKVSNSEWAPVPLSAETTEATPSGLMLALPLTPGIFRGDGDVIARAVHTALARSKKPAVAVSATRFVMQGVAPFVHIATDAGGATAHDVEVVLRAFAVDKNAVAMWQREQSTQPRVLLQTLGQRALIDVDEVLCFGEVKAEALSPAVVRAALSGPVTNVQSQAP